MIQFPDLAKARQLDLAKRQIPKIAQAIFALIEPIPERNHDLLVSARDELRPPSPLFPLRLLNLPLAQGPERGGIDRFPVRTGTIGAALGLRG